MRRLVVAILAAALAITLAGCGGGGTQETGTGTDTTGGAATPPPVSLAAGQEDVIPDRSPTETVTYEPLNQLASNLPSAVEQRLQKKQPMLIFIFDSTQKSSSETRAEIDAAMKSYRGLIDLVSYDVSRYVTTNPDTGAMTVNPKLLSDAEAVKVAEMIQQLDISFTPFILMVNADGILTWRSRGYTERKLIESEILKATQ